MKFNLGAMETNTQHQQYPRYHSLSSSSHLFSQQPITGQDTIRRRFEIRERIKREIEKERIRQEIIAEEMARRRVLEAEVRNELMMERHVAMRRAGGGFAAPFMRPSHRDVFLQPRLFGADDKVVMSDDEKFGRGDGFCGVRGVSVKPIQVLGDSTRIMAKATPLLEDNHEEVIVLDKPNDGTLSGTKRKSTLSVSEGSSQPGPHRSDRSRKKVKEEWSCAICQVTTTSEHGLMQHIQGKKHQVKEAALVAQKTGANVGLGVAPKIPCIKPVPLALTTITTSSSETNKPSSSSDPNEVNKKDVMDGKSKRDKFKFWCDMCQVGAFSEAVMNNHKKGKKHSTRLVEFNRKCKVDSEASATENTCDSKDKSETKSNLEVVVATGTVEVKTVEDNMAYVAATAAEESNTTTG